MNAHFWFPTPIFSDILQFDTKSIAKFILKLEKNDYPNRVVSNEGGWQSLPIDWEDPQVNKIKSIKEILVKNINNLSMQVFGIEDNFSLVDTWININRKGNSNVKHLHPFSAFSGTLYIQTDKKTGNITFFDDYTPYDHYKFIKDETTLLFHRSVSYIPTNGMLIFFPSWVPHEVEPSKSNLTRISISFNILQNYKSIPKTMI